MKRAWKPLGAAIAVIVVAGSLVAGRVVRERVDRGGEGGGIRTAATGTLVASTVTDPRSSEVDLFFRLVDLLRREYVEPIQDAQALASGAVRGMVGVLADPDSFFLSPEQVARFDRERRGIYEGIGAELDLVYDAEALRKARDGVEIEEPTSLIPNLVVSSVLPGSPAEQVGLRVGDRIVALDSRWVLSSETFERYRKLQRELSTGRKPGPELIELRKRLQEKARTGLTPARARDRLGQGQTGQVSLIWERSGREMKADVPLRRIEVPPVIDRGDRIELRLFEGASERLASALRGRREAVIDLRSSPWGADEELGACLSELLPAGTYGRFVSDNGRPPRPIAVRSGTGNAPRLKVLVDRWTKGAAEVLALALAASGRARLEGGPTAGRAYERERMTLPDGSAYVLVTGRWE